MDYTLSSYDPSNYGKLKFNLSLPINLNRVRFRITHFQSIANFKLLEKGTTMRFLFKSQGEQMYADLVVDRDYVKISDAVALMSKLIKPNVALVFGLACDWNEDETRIKFTAGYEF
jgi:hypothetical protein